MCMRSYWKLTQIQSVRELDINPTFLLYHHLTKSIHNPKDPQYFSRKRKAGGYYNQPAFNRFIFRNYFVLFKIHSAALRSM